MADAGVGDDGGPVHVRCPQVVDALAVVREHGGEMENGIEAFFGERPFDQILVPDVALYACEVRMFGGIRAKVDAYARVSLVKELFLQDGAEKTGSASNQET